MRKNKTISKKKIEKEFSEINKLLNNQNFLNSQNYALWKMKKKDILARYYAYMFDIVVMKIAYFLVYSFWMFWLVLWVGVILFLLMEYFFTNLDKNVIFSFFWFLFIWFLLVDFFTKKFRKISCFIGAYVIILVFFMIAIGLLYVTFVNNWWFLFGLGIIIFVFSLFFGVYKLLILFIRVIVFIPAYIIFLLLSVFFIERKKIFYTKINFNGEKIDIFEFKKYVSLDKNTKEEILLRFLFWVIWLAILFLVYWIFVLSGRLEFINNEGTFIWLLILIWFIFWTLQKSKKFKKFIRFLVNLDIEDIVKVNLAKRNWNFYIIGKFLVVKK